MVFVEQPWLSHFLGFQDLPIFLDFLAWPVHAVSHDPAGSPGVVPHLPLVPGKSSKAALRIATIRISPSFHQIALSRLQNPRYTLRLDIRRHNKRIADHEFRPPSSCPPPPRNIIVFAAPAPSIATRSRPQTIPATRTPEVYRHRAA